MATGRPQNGETIKILINVPHLQRKWPVWNPSERYTASVRRLTKTPPPLHRIRDEILGIQKGTIAQETRRTAALLTVSRHRDWSSQTRPQNRTQHRTQHTTNLTTTTSTINNIIVIIIVVIIVIPPILSQTKENHNDDHADKNSETVSKLLRILADKEWHHKMYKPKMLKHELQKKTRTHIQHAPKM